MNELEKWGERSPRVPSREDRAHGRAVGKVKRDTQMAALTVDAHAALSGRIMERAVDIDNYRRSLAGDDPTLNAVLTRIELGFVTNAERIQRSFGSEFGR
jgi:hypothetical protein